MTVRLNDVDIRMEPDSGAEVNLMDEHQFQALLHRTNEKPTLEHWQIKLNTLQHPLHVKGKFETIIRNQTCGKPATFVVVKGRINSPPLLSKDTLIELGMLKQPIHFISRTLTDVEQRYSQTEKDALCVKWAKDRFSMYLMGAPRFTIVTAHKPLLPLFNKATAKLPPRIEKWVMDMQDVDYEM